MESQSATKKSIYLAALLEDIGELQIRASADIPNPDIAPITVKSYDKSEEKVSNAVILPDHHLYWTYRFIKSKEDKYPFLGDALRLIFPESKQSIKHKRMLRVAGSWAKGHENSVRAQQESHNPENGKAPLNPIGNIFQSLHIKGAQGTANTTFSLSPLNIDSEVFFPTIGKPDTIKLQAQYKELWDSFNIEFDLLPTCIDCFNESLLFLLKKYLWRVPVDSKGGLEFTSLFDYVKTKAAIASSLYDYYQNRESDSSLDQSTLKTFPLLLLCVELSGIQKFIYNIYGKQAAKALKGRSFYLQALLDGVALTIINRTQNYQGNLIYSGGGKFFMLLPNDESTKNKLKEIENELTKGLWEAFGGDLFICFGHAGFWIDPSLDEGNVEIEELGGHYNFGELWRLVNNRSSQKKKKKFANILSDEFSSIFSPHGVGGEIPVCYISGVESDHLIQKKYEINEETVRVTKQIDNQVEIGKKLVSNKFVSFILNEKSNENSIRIFGDYSFEFSDLPICQEGAFSYLILTETSPKFLQAKPITAKLGFKYFGGSSQPMKNGKLKTFEQLCEDEVNNKLGVLRMDVDSLGELFISGFNSLNASFCNYSALSEMLDIFFSGYVNTLRSSKIFDYHINIIYSGGDDLFAVGRWDKIILFADQIQSDFKRYTSRTDTTLSAGIVIVGPKFPIGKSALMSGEAEEDAKSHQFGQFEKNSLSLFGIEANFDFEMPLIKHWRSKLSGWIGENYITKGLLMQLLAYYNQYAKSLVRKPTEGRNVDLSWKWNLSYNLARRAQTASKDDTRRALDEIKNLILIDIDNNDLRFETFAVACRLAELDTKTKK